MSRRGCNDFKPIYSTPIQTELEINVEKLIRNLIPIDQKFSYFICEI